MTRREFTVWIIVILALAILGITRAERLNGATILVAVLSVAMVARYDYLERRAGR